MIFPLGIPDSRALPSFSGQDSGPAHTMFKSFFVAEARKNRVLMHKTVGEISAGYERKAKAAARFAAHHHIQALADLRIANLRQSIVKMAERDLPSDERRGAWMVRP